jgi:hypothetical protein
MSLPLLVRDIPFVVILLRFLGGHLAAQLFVVPVGMPSLGWSRNRRLRMFRLSFALLILSSFVNGVSHINKLLWEFTFWLLRYDLQECSCPSLAISASAF